MRIVIFLLIIRNVGLCAGIAQLVEHKLPSLGREFDSRFPLQSAFISSDFLAQLFVRSAAKCFIYFKMRYFSEGIMHDEKSQLLFTCTPFGL